MITAVLVPGGGYTTQGPLFDLADAVLTARRDAVEPVEWSVPDGLLEVGPEPFVRVHVAAALHRARTAAPHGRPVLIAKSLGSHAAALAADEELPAIWLTPILTDDSVVEAITANRAPQLLIGGTDDRFWMPQAAEATGKQVLQIADADHSLRVPGPVRRYAEVLATVGTAMEDFFAAVTANTDPTG
ncbi:alpha/beta hydrolase [Couchioplanes caeruleus]|uniref:Alpha/beta hydrolase n=2 Tax=Couchioplanes caeruleus TaxID=56438 RepID=A0A1K0F9U3_9ACTN|nr:alpha/beta hydrolase [Couchioplanes caeruleus]OJF09504.1 hypothetical protein BG844_37240 [Couchioplanes caeruleus subsp. caeruleus]ROP33771.1 hypothetical protein EDD30_6812 [Couchioplanes caeruleus]